MDNTGAVLHELCNVETECVEAIQMMFPSNAQARNRVLRYKGEPTRWVRKDSYHA